MWEGRECETYEYGYNFNAERNHISMHIIFCVKKYIIILMSWLIIDYSQIDHVYLHFPLFLSYTI